MSPTRPADPDTAQADLARPAQRGGRAGRVRERGVTASSPSLRRPPLNTGSRGSAESSSLAPVPLLIDCRGIMAEYGVPRGTAQGIMRQLELVRFKGVRKVFVRRADVRGLMR